MAIPIGLDGYFYYNAGSYASPSWTLIPYVKDISSVNFEVGEADGSSRISRWRRRVRTLKDFSIEFSMVKDTSNETIQEVLRDAFINSTDVEFAVADGPIATAGTDYVRAAMGIFKYEETEGLEDVIMVNISLKLVPSSNDPAFATAS